MGLVKGLNQIALSAGEILERLMPSKVDYLGLGWAANDMPRSWRDCVPRGIEHEIISQQRPIILCGS
jgi:hypothetical protein